MSEVTAPSLEKVGVEVRALVSPLKGRKVLMIVENLPVPLDRRVWQEALTLRNAGAQVSVICPKGKGFEAAEEILQGIHIYRHGLPREGRDAIGFLLEYSAALFHEARLACKIFFRHGFDVVHACNPPDLIFLVALPFKLFGKRFIFDHHDINPEMYETKFGKRGMFWHILCFLEWLTFKIADVVISTNESYRAIAITRGGKRSDDVFVVRSGPDLKNFKHGPPDAALRKGRRFLVGYVGIMGVQDGIDLLLESARHLVRDKGRNDIQFMLVGGGPELERLKMLSHKLGLEDHVTFAGFQYGADLNVFLNSIDIGVCPDPRNSYSDRCTMNKIMEYMGAGKPLVQFDLREGRVSAAEASFYARPNDPIDFAEKIENLLSDDVRRAHMGSFGRLRVEQELAWEYEASKLVAAYERSFSVRN